MMTELSFLIDLLLNHKLQKATKDLIVARIKDIESTHLPTCLPTAGVLPFYAQKQAPSTLAALARQGMLERTVEVPAMPETNTCVEVIAQTAATAQAMASRQQAIAESLAGKIDKTTGRPRKF